MDLINKAEEIVVNIKNEIPKKSVKKIAVFIARNEYKSKRELIFNLRSCRLIENDKVYLSRLENLIIEEELLINEIQKLKL